MSRIGKLPIEIPANAKVTVDGQIVRVEGPKGKLEKSFNRAVSIRIEDNVVIVEPAGRSRLARAMYGTARSIINNMVIGVVDGYKKELEIQGVGFRAAVSGKTLDLALGYSHPIKFTIPDGVTVTVAENTKLSVEGADKQVVGEVTATIYSYYPVEPYKGKGVRIVGQQVRRKEGKKTA
jgi:large subunit ribosomal protein L6